MVCGLLRDGKVPCLGPPQEPGAGVGAGAAVPGRINTTVKFGKFCGKALWLQKASYLCFFFPLRT